MNTAVVYYSLTGNTKLTAEKIAAELNADLISLVPKKAYPDKGAGMFFWGGKSAVMGDRPELMPYNFDAEKYDTIVFGTPVWAGTFTPPLRTFVLEHPEIKDKKTAVFCCSGGGKADKAISKLCALIGKDNFAASLLLFDPKEKQNDENDRKISEFCEKIK